MAKKNYKDFTPCQVLTGFIFWGKEWMKEPILKVKGSELRDKLGLSEYISPMSLFGQQAISLDHIFKMHRKKNQPNDAVSKQLLDIDDKMMLLMDLMQGKHSRCFLTHHSKVRLNGLHPLIVCPKLCPRHNSSIFVQFSH